MNKKIIWILVIVVIILIIVGVTSRQENKDDLKIGLISSLSGLTVGGDNLGQGFANGAQLAHEEYMSKNPNSKIELIIENDGYESKKGLSAYQKLTSIDTVDALINLSSPTIDVISQDVRSKNIPVIQLGAEAEIFVDSIFQMYPDQTSIGMLGVLADEEGIKDVMLVTQQIKAYEKFVSDFDDNYSGELVIERISPTEKDMSSLSLKIKEQNPEALVVFMGSKEGAQLIKKLRDINYVPEKIYFDLNLQLGAAEYVEILGNLDFLNGAKSLYSYAEANEDFNARYEARFGGVTGVLSGFGYDSYNVMLENYSENINDWNSSMIKYQKEGVTGKISFNKEGLRPAQFKIAEVIGGELVAE